MSLLRNLNSVQRLAVEKITGPNLILAGAGSGKTRVLTHKIAYLIQRKKVKPENILAMTFTNKAANEMKDRVEALLKGPVKRLWIGTFHSVFARILRKNCEKLGYASNFVVFDETDQLALIKSVINDIGIDLKSRLEPRKIRYKIKFLKNSNIPPEKFKLLSDNSQGNDIFIQVYAQYQQRLQQNNAMDFEDLLLKAVDLFKLFPSVLGYYQNKFHYILVDEYQDTNRIQYELLKLLAEKHQNISVVGDDDQSIYRWRGADVRNILEFEKDYSDCTVFRLEQNYRSTGNILSVAHSIISHNVNRMEKQLWTKKDPGEKVTFMLAENAHEEALKIALKIEQEFHKKQRNFSDFAILYRTNAQSRAIEEVLKNKAINYTIIGGIRFYERKEIKDLLAYLRVLTNPNDNISLKRIINYPTRGIGDATVKKLEAFSRKHNISLFQALSRVNEITSIAEKTRNKIIEFHNLIKKYIKLKKDRTITVSELVATLIGELEIIQNLKQEATLEALNRIDNIRELINGINEFIVENPHLSLEHYLENVALITDVDNWDSKANAVSLLTLHSAKGLEFPVVFISGLEEGLFPLTRQMEHEEDIEEERRLFYVGATRAMEKLYLSTALNRRKWGENSNGTISRFLNEIDQDLLEIDETMVPRSTTYESMAMRRVKKRIPLAERKAIDQKLKVGMLVKHPQFGKGVVRSIHETGDGKKLAILFEEVGEKMLLLKYAKLEIIL